MTISYKSLYSFKEDYCRTSTLSLYRFNGIQSFIDTLNKDMFNSDKMSWDGWHYMYCNEKENVYLSGNIMMW